MSEEIEKNVALIQLFTNRMSPKFFFLKKLNLNVVKNQKNDKV